MANAPPPAAHRPPMWLSRSLSVGPSATSRRSSRSTARTAVSDSSHPLSDTPAPASPPPPALPRRPSPPPPATSSSSQPQQRETATPPLPRRPSAPTVTWTSNASHPHPDAPRRPSSLFSSSSRSTHASSSHARTPSTSTSTPRPHRDGPQRAPSPQPSSARSSLARSSSSHVRPPSASTSSISTSTSRPHQRPPSPHASPRSSLARSSSSHARPSSSSHSHSSHSRRRASPARKKISLSPPPLEPDVRGKLARHRSYALRDYLSARRRKPKPAPPDFPPPAESVASGYDGSVESFADAATHTPDAEPACDGTTVDPAGDATPTPGTPTEADSTGPEPATLARRIQGLLAAPARGAADTRLAALLGDARVMAGAGRYSVFAALDRLRLPTRLSTAVDAEGEGYDGDDDGSSIMLYGPLEPEEGSEAEIARSDVVSVSEAGEVVEWARPARRVSMLQFEEFEREEAERIRAMWGVGEEIEGRVGALEVEVGERKVEVAEQKVEVAEWKVEVGERKAEEGEVEGKGEGGERRAEAVEGTSATAWTMTWFESWKGKAPQAEALKPPCKARKKLVWVPSPDKVSLQATWWGYRLYLPPPVLDVLNNKRLEAAKRAALITAALKWLLDAVPATVVPPQFRAGLLIAQQLAPYLGYVGGFMAWSWGAIKSFDKGYGVVLTATWLLPVALIPGTWEASDFVQPDASDAGDATEREGLA